MSSHPVNAAELNSTSDQTQEQNFVPGWGHAAPQTKLRDLSSLGQTSCLHFTIQTTTLGQGVCVCVSDVLHGLELVN